MDVATEDQGTLLEAIAQGDQAALRRLYDVAAPRMLGIAIRMLGRRDLAEEAVQDAFIAVWSAAGSYDRSLGRPQAWLATIVRHKAIDRLRASPWMKNEVGDAEPNATQHGDLNALAVRQCLDRLDTSQSRALMLVYYYGLTHSELGRQLKAPLGTVKSWIRRGLLGLKQCLEE